MGRDPTRHITDADQWQRVSAVGVFDAERQVLLRYRTSGDLNGYEVLTPLRTTAGTVLVARGIVPLSAGQEVPSTAPPPPTGTVTVVGHVRRNEVGRSSARVPVNGRPGSSTPTPSVRRCPTPSRTATSAC